MKELVSATSSPALAVAFVVDDLQSVRPWQPRGFAATAR
jgi:hypothetical protein